MYYYLLPRPLLDDIKVSQRIRSSREQTHSKPTGELAMGDGRVWGEARNDLARIQDISIWPLMVAWPAGTVLGLFVASF